MKPLNENYKNAEASTGNDFVALPPGAYICRITDAIDHDEDKPFIEVTFDIADGEHKGYYSDDWGTKNLWAHSRRHYYTDKAMGMFKGFIKAVDESNGTNFNAEVETGFDETKLIGKLIGYVVGEEEYESNTGEIRTRLDWRNAKVGSVSQIKSGKCAVPPKKTLKVSEPPISDGFGPISDDDMPF